MPQMIQYGYCVIIMGLWYAIKLLPLVANWVLIELVANWVLKLRSSTRQHTTRTCLEECSVTEENVLSVEYNDSTSIPSWMGYRIFIIRVN